MNSSQPTLSSDSSETSPIFAVYPRENDRGTLRDS